MRRQTPFWRAKSIDEMNEAEWESLCDGCGLCCQIRVEDEDTGEVALSDAACRLLDLCTHRCSDYANRQRKVPDCVKITPENVKSLDWLPHTCAYRLVAFVVRVFWFYLRWRLWLWLWPCIDASFVCDQARD